MSIELIIILIIITITGFLSWRVIVQHNEIIIDTAKQPNNAFSRNFITAHINTKNKTTIEESCQKLVNKIKSNVTMANLIQYSNKIVIVIVGSNGSGKTTTCFKIAKHEHDNHIPIVCTTDFYKSSIDYFNITAQENNIPHLSCDIPGKTQRFYADYYINQFANSCYSMLIIDTAGINYKKTNLVREIEALCNCIRTKCISRNISVVTMLAINARNYEGEALNTITSDADCITINHVTQPIDEFIFNLISDIGEQHVILSINHNNNINDLTIFSKQMIKMSLYNTLIKIIDNK